MIPYELPKERTDFPCKEYKALWDGYEFCDLPGYLNESRAQVKSLYEKLDMQKNQIIEKSEN